MFGNAVNCYTFIISQIKTQSGPDDLFLIYVINNPLFIENNGLSHPYTSYCIKRGR